jgi:AraC-like DNA-binding protein
VAVLLFQPHLIREEGRSDNGEYLTPFLLQDSQFPHVVPAKSGIPYQAFDLMQRIRVELPATTLRARRAVKKYLKMILHPLANRYASYAGTVETFRRQQRALQRLQPLFEHLERNFVETIRVQEASFVCGMSESHFMSFFKRTTGQSFKAYLNHYRIERAQALLGMTHKSLSDISREIGFCDQSYFGAVFRKLLGMTPASYRARSCPESCRALGFP